MCKELVVNGPLHEEIKASVNVTGNKLKCTKTKVQINTEIGSIARKGGVKS